MILLYWGENKSARVSFETMTNMCLSSLNRLTQDIPFSEYILPICLPPDSDPDEPDFYEGSEGLVVGWGWMKNRSGTSSNSSLVNPSKVSHAQIPPEVEGL
jgi:hypothetical protein